MVVACVKKISRYSSVGTEGNFENFVQDNQGKLDRIFPNYTSDESVVCSLHCYNRRDVFHES
jgi:hypothetical protein